MSSLSDEFTGWRQFSVDSSIINDVYSKDIVDIWDGRLLCSRCSTRKEVSEFPKNNKNRRGCSYWCKECYKIYDRQRDRKPRYCLHKKEISNQARKYHQSSKGKYRSYKESAKRRSFPFELSIEEFITFWQKPCHYCGDSIETIGLDRIDNSKGYSLDNCVSCCYICNIMKASLDKETFISHIRKINNHFKGVIVDG